MKSLAELKKNLKKDLIGLRKIKIAILGDSATQLLSLAIKGMCIDYGYEADLYEADFNQIELQVFNSESELYSFHPDFIVLFYSSHKLLNSFYKSEEQTRLDFAEKKTDQFISICNALNSKLKTQIVFFNFPEIDDHVYGSFSNKFEGSFLFQLRKLNYLLTEKSKNLANFHICDLSSIQNSLGKKNIFHSSIYINTDMVIGIDALPLVAKYTVDIMAVLKGKMNKCVILDLDNTLWGGIIGDDGLEHIQIGGLGIGKAFTEFQYWLKELKSRGIILAVCSKNNEEIAKEPFLKHPEMILRLDDISVFIANWENKASNIRHIQEILNIGFDSMVFLDDNPFERNMVRENIKDITVPELPEDPAEYLEFLYTQNLFETSGISKEDTERTKQYQTESLRMEYQKSFVDEDDFMKNLNMISKVEGFTEFNTPRVAQLSQRSNQFNLRTIRYNESDIQQMISATEIFPFAFHLEDKFGDHGLISLVILKKHTENILFIDTWLMSCRVLKRGMENFVLNTLVDFSIEKGFEKIVGEYIATSKNEMVKDHYLKLGFMHENGIWNLNVLSYQNKKTFIHKKTEHVKTNYSAANY